MLSSPQAAYALLDTLGAPAHLKTHVMLVGEAAELLIEACEQLGLTLDFEFIRIGVVIHDIGKIVHPLEMTGPGSEHETTGEQLLLKHGVSPKIAKVCLSHARWHQMDTSLEELIIALSDKLWKGKRVEALELEVVDQIATRLALQRWDLFSELDLQFETIAASGDERLQRSMLC